MSAVQARALLLFQDVHVVAARDAEELVYDIDSEQRLGQEAVDSGVERLIHYLVPVVRRQYDDCGLFSVSFAYLGGYFNAVELRHLPVEQHKVVRIVPGVADIEHLKSPAAAQGGIGSHAGFFHYHKSVLAGDRIIVDDKHVHVLRVEDPDFRIRAFTILQGHDHSKLCAFSFF